MFFPKIDVKDDPVRRWYRPDRHFFANGACQVLAFAFLERYPDFGFHVRWIKPAAGFSGNHIYVTDGINAFDYHGLVTEQRLLGSASSEAAVSFQAGTPRWWICRPTFSSPNIARGRSTDFGSVSPPSSSTTRCRAPAPFSIASTVSFSACRTPPRTQLAVPAPATLRCRRACRRCPACAISTPWRQ